MKVALPEKFEFQSENGKYKFEFTPHENPLVIHPTGKWVWKNVKVPYPSKVILAPEANVIYFLGSYGGAGLGLGHITIRDLQSGKILHDVQLSEKIMTLEAMSRNYGKMTNFLWIDSTLLKNSGSQLEVDVCGQVTVLVDSKSGQAEITKTLRWFETFGCEELSIEDFDSLKSKEPKKQLMIKDSDYIRSLQTSINQLIPKGDIMKDISENASLLNLKFRCQGKDQVIEFYDGRIKTPATSFYGSNRHEEKSLWIEFQSLLSEKNAELNIPQPYFQGRTVNFKDFSLTYLISEDRTPKGTTASSYVQVFELRDKKDNSKKTIEVHSGQLPPRPVDFENNMKKYTLYTFSFDRKKLDPRHLLVLEK